MPYTAHPTQPLLRQARDRLATARKAEAAARMAWDGDRQHPALQQALTAAQQETRQAQGWLDQVERSRAVLPTALAEARRTLLTEETTYTGLVETHRKAEAQQLRRVQQAREAVARLEADRRTIVGPEAGG
jgi:hypothetical protein